MNSISQNLPPDKHLQTKQPFWKVGHGHMGLKAGQLNRKACLLELIVEASGLKRQIVVTVYYL